MHINNMLTTLEQFATAQGKNIVYDDLFIKHTYADLKRDSDAIAAYIDSLNLTPKAPIVVFGGQEYEMLATFIGLTKAGHAYIPVDANSANERLLSIIEIAQPAAVIAIHDLPLELTTVRVIAEKTLKLAMHKATPYALTHAVADDETYYIIFTSGTTGQPKGVQISHNNLLSFVNWVLTDPAFALPNQPQMLAQPPYSFDLSVMYWAPTLAAGGTLYPLAKAQSANLKTLFEFLPRLTIQVWTSTPSFVEMAMLNDEFNAVNMPTISHFYFCGEELTVSTAAKLHERFPNARIVNSFGPTEATVAFSAVAVTPAMLASGERLPIGHIKADSPTYIVDENGLEVPRGTQGEIIVTGPAVSKGYLNNPDKTKQAFFQINGLPAYHTGDVGHMDADGMLYYGGRMDFQIKFNGFRIELEEVAFVLKLSKYIDNAVAVPRYNADHKVQQLLAYVVAKPAAKTEFDKALQLTMAIKQELQNEMMDYMMPSKFIYVDALPITPNGKVDIKTLIAEVNNK
ncbi:MAG: D-alanine--poly(phosphoribitol) ligase subunit DltA [Lactobacillaceae bacterium]|jgi:D-alanine--poly(phosphoribitol) ligase subunit 1|nr:D-alanine--poly(phosphoribitol) ligase subunit DltA [Lactobacillaceae bacterium]